jgi:hypothetical protein
MNAWFNPGSLRFVSSFSRLLLFAVASVVPLLILAAALYWFFQRPEGLSVSDQLHLATKSARNLLEIGLVAGVGSMAVVEVRKRLGRTRGRFHLRELRQRFGGGLNHLYSSPRYAYSPRNSRSRYAYSPLNLRHETLVIQLDVPLEQVVAQLGATAEEAFLKPGEFVDFLACLGGDRAYDAVKALAAQPTADQEREDDPNIHHAALRQAIEKGLDSLQTELGSRWQYRLRIEAAAIAGVIGLVVVSIADTGPLARLSVLGVTFVWGGFFAWLARDVVAGIQKWRS